MLSTSVNDQRFELQRRGYAAAFTNPKIIRAIRASPHGQIAVTLFEWAAVDAQARHRAVDGDIGRRGRAAGRRELLRERARCAAGRRFSAAIDFAVRLFDANPFPPNAALYRRLGRRRQQLGRPSRMRATGGGARHHDQRPGDPRRVAAAAGDALAVPLDEFTATTSLAGRARSSSSPRTSMPSRGDPEQADPRDLQPAQGRRRGRPRACRDPHRARGRPADRAVAVIGGSGSVTESCRCGDEPGAMSTSGVGLTGRRRRLARAAPRPLRQLRRDASSTSVETV